MIPDARKGFTLVETLVAITVLVIAVVGPLYAVHKSVTASYTARDALIASSLAQEGMEYVRSVRDGNYLTNDPNWLDDLSTCIITNGEGPSDYGCGVDTYDEQFVACDSSGCMQQKLVIDSSGYRYRQTVPGNASRFSRKITIVQVSANEIEVKVVVSWSTLRIPYTVTVTENMYNWL